MIQDSKAPLVSNEPTHLRPRAKRRRARPPHLWPRPIDPKFASDLTKRSPYRSGDAESLVTNPAAEAPAKPTYWSGYTHPVLFRPDLLFCERDEIYGVTLASHFRSLVVPFIVVSLIGLWVATLSVLAGGLASSILALFIVLISVRHPHDYLILVGTWLDDHGQTKAVLPCFNYAATRARGSSREASCRLFHLSYLRRKGRVVEALREAELLLQLASERESEIAQRARTSPDSKSETESKQQIAAKLHQLAFARVLWIKLDLAACDEVELQLTTSRISENSEDLVVALAFVEIRLRLDFERGAAPSAEHLEKAHQFFIECIARGADIPPLTLLIALLIWAHHKRGSVKNASELHDLYRAYGCPLALELRLPALMPAIPDCIEPGTS